MEIPNNKYLSSTGVTHLWEKIKELIPYTWNKEEKIFYVDGKIYTTNGFYKTNGENVDPENPGGGSIDIDDLPKASKSLYGVVQIGEGINVVDGEISIDVDEIANHIGEGPQGPAGPAGPTGPTGPTGPAGEYTPGNNIDITDNIISTEGYTYKQESNAFIEGENHKWLRDVLIPYKVHVISDEEKEALGFYSGSIAIDYDYCINCQDKAIISIIHDDKKLNLQQAQIKQCSGTIGVDGNIIIQTPNTNGNLGDIELKLFNLDLSDENGEQIILNNDTEYNFSYPDPGLSSHAEGSGSIGIGLASHAEGYLSHAEGAYSHAEGFYSHAEGYNSHAEGNATVANGIGSHSEGEKTFASSIASHAEGFETIASGVASHSEGAKYESNRSTESAGQASHAEGASTYAKADGSHTEGILNTAGRFLDEISTAAQELGISGTQEELAAKLLGYGAHAEGMNNEALGSCSHAEGHTTKALANSTHAEGDTTIAFGEASHAEGYNTQAKGNQSHAEGSNTVAIGNSSHTEGASTTASGSFAHAEGSHTEASGRDSHAEGAYNKAIGIASHAEGSETTTEGEASHAEGSGSIGIGLASHAEGNNTSAQGLASHTEGINTTANGIASHVEGCKSTTGGSATTNDLIKGTSTVSGSYAHAEGNATLATGVGSHSEGQKTFAQGLASHTEGVNTTAYGMASHVEGCKSTTGGSATTNDLIIGTSTDSGSYAHAEGNATIAKGISSHSEGQKTFASGNYSHAEGYNTKASGSASHAEGYGTTASGNSSHAEGSSTKAIGSYSHAEGYNTTASGGYSHTEGFLTTASNNYSHAEGYNTKASGSASHAEGYGTKALGDYSHAEGESTTAQGKSSHAEGQNNLVSYDYSHAEGKNNAILGTSSPRCHVEGGGNAVFLSNSHAEGSDNISHGYVSHIEGVFNTVTGYGAHAEGFGNIASGDSAHAEGGIAEDESDYKYTVELDSATYNSSTGILECVTKTEIPDDKVSSCIVADFYYGTGSWDFYTYWIKQVEKISATSYKFKLHEDALSCIINGIKPDPSTIGTINKLNLIIRGNIASGNSSHSEGKFTTARGNYSHAEGLYTITTNEAEHTEGKYNKSNTGTISSIGIGTSITDRMNAFEVMQNGDTYLINVGGYDGTNSEIKTLQNVKAKSLQEIIDSSTQLKVKLDLKRFYVGDYENAQELYIGFPSGTDVTDFELEVVRWGSVKYRISNEGERKTVLKYTGEHKIKNISETPMYISDWTHDKDLFQVKIGEYGYDRDGYSYYRVLGKVISQNTSGYSTEYVGMLEYINTPNSEDNTKFLPIRYKNFDGSFKIPAEFFNKKNNGICVRFNNKTISKMVKFGTIWDENSWRIKI